MNVKRLLDSYYHKYNNHLSSKDPVWNLQFANSDSDKELLAFFVSCYAYGNIIQINKHIKKFIDLTSGNIYSFIREFESVAFASLLKNKYQKESYCYRFNTEQDFIDLLYSLKIIIMEYGSLKSLFLKHYNKTDENILPALNKFASEIRNAGQHSKSFDYLIPDVSKNSACKRLNLFLRWMVRKDSIDTGLWSREVDKSKLIIPVDTHVFKVSQKLGLAKRKSCDIKYAIELTERLQKYDAQDPVKYDFALCHIGVDKILI
ncbi:MAG: TIGR02757 family protein [Ignavibacteriota bacterium]|nr:TIGR02757 family protein [Ignavibacteriota bacterium]